MKKKGKKKRISKFWDAQSTIVLESTACGLRGMRKGQKHLLKLIEAEIKRRRREGE